MTKVELDIGAIQSEDEHMVSQIDMKAFHFRCWLFQRMMNKDFKSLRHRALLQHMYRNMSLEAEPRSFLPQ